MIGTINLVYGTDEYLKKKSVDKIKKDFFKEDQYDADSIILMENVPFEEIYEQITLPSFFKSKKLILVRNSNLFTTKEKDKKNMQKALEFFEMFKSVDLIEYSSLKHKKENGETLSQIQEEQFSKMDDALYFLDDLCIIFQEDEKGVSKENKIYKIFKSMSMSNTQTMKKSPVHIYEALAISVLDKEKILLDYAKENNINISLEDIKFFMDYTPNDIYNLLNEFAKLGFLEKTKEGKKITKEDIRSCIIPTDEQVIFDIVNYIKTDKPKAQEQIDGFYQKNQILPCLQQIYQYYKSLYLAKMSQQEDTTGALSVILDLSPRRSFLTKIYLNECKKFSTPKLLYIMDQLNLVDYYFKQSDSKMGLLILKNLIVLI